MSITQKQEQQNWTGLRYMFLSVLAFTVMNSFAKYLDNVSSFQIVLFRALGTLILCFSYLKLKAIPIWGNNKKFLFLRAFFGTISMALFFLAIKELPFGSAVSLRYVSPIFAAIFAVILLKEKINSIQWFSFFIAFAGVLILKGFDSRVSILGLSFIIISALFSGLVYVTIRHIGKSEHPIVIIFYFMLLATIFGGILSIFTWQEPSSIDWLFLCMMGIFGFVGQFYMTKAYQIASIAVIAPVKYIESIFALVIGWIWFAEGYKWISLLGIVLVIGGMLINLFGQQIKKAKS